MYLCRDRCAWISPYGDGVPPVSHPANLDECRLGHFVAPGSKHEGSFARSGVYIARRSTPKGWAGTLEEPSTRTGGQVMTESTDEGAFPELFEVIQGYAQRDYNHQVKALRMIAAAYLPLFEVPPMPDAKQVVEDVLSHNEFLMSNPQTGQLEPASVDAVVSVATSRLVEEDLKWGAECLLNIMDALRRRAQSEGYETYVVDAEEVLDGLETILAADIVEDVIEDIVEEG